MNQRKKQPHHPDFCHRLSEDEFMAEMGKGKDGRFSYLQIFHNRKAKMEFGDLYLYVSRKNFGIVRVLDLFFEDEKLYVMLQSINSKDVVTVPIDIYERQFQCLFFNLDDIKDMLNEEFITDKDVTDLLESNGNLQ